eukprot:472132-Alexandrium_andersonii.AAC.1
MPFNVGDAFQRLGSELADAVVPFQKGCCEDIAFLTGAVKGKLGAPGWQAKRDELLQPTNAAFLSSLIENPHYKDRRFV